MIWESPRRDGFNAVTAWFGAQCLSRFEGRSWSWRCDILRMTHTVFGVVKEHRRARVAEQKGTKLSARRPATTRCLGLFYVSCAVYYPLPCFHIFSYYRCLLLSCLCGSAAMLFLNAICHSCTCPIHRQYQIRLSDKSICLSCLHV